MTLSQVSPGVVIVPIPTQVPLTCPSCGLKPRESRIPCPDQIPGCSVAHYGFHCSCGKFWNRP